MELILFIQTDFKTKERQKTETKKGKMDMTKKASIIIPIYNSEKYLENCIESVLKQTEQDYELILINDGSKDSSEEIMTKYKNKYPEKIKIFSQENRGIGETRNRGIKEAEGKYIFFIDNDDEIKEDYLETFINEAEKSDFNMVLGGYETIDEYGKLIGKTTPQKTDWSFLRIIMPWARVYKKDFLIKNDLKFLDTRLGEDVSINVPAFFISDKNKLSIIDYCGYKWTERKTSESNSTQKNTKKWVDAEKTLRHILKIIDINKLSEEEQRLLECFFIKFSIRFVLYTGKNAEIEDFAETSKEIKSFLNEIFPNFLKRKNFTITYPKGEPLSVNIIICIFKMILKYGLEKIFAKFYIKKNN